MFISGYLRSGWRGRDPDDQKVDRILESGPPEKTQEGARTIRQLVPGYIRLIVFLSVTASRRKSIITILQIIFQLFKF